MSAALMNMWNLNSKTYVVTGGTKGIGYATARSLLAHGAAGVLICARGRDDCDAAVASLSAEFPSAPTPTPTTPPTPTRVHAVVCDVSTTEGRDTLIAAVRETFGDRLDGLVNNVGTNVRKDVSEQTAPEYHAMMRTNVDSVYFLCKGLKELLSDGASVVNVASAAGVQSSGTGAVYGTTKAAVIQLSKILACEWAKDNIRVNAVAPWMTMTPMLERAIEGGGSKELDKARAWTPVGRLGRVEEIAGPITFLLMPCSGYVTGQCLGIDGGLTAQGFDGPCVTPP